MRLFLAIDLPDAVRAALAELQGALRRACPGWRWIRPEGIHLTLRFLGDVAPSEEERQRETWRRVAAEHAPFRFGVGGLGVFPGGARPRVLWAGVEDLSERGELASVAASLERAARDFGFEAEARPFRAHLTLARAERDGRPVAPPPGGAAIAPEVLAEEVVLFRSELDPRGARYFRVAAFPLGGPA